MGWFRSAPMEYWSVAIPQNASHKVVSALGKLGAIQFVDVRCAWRCCNFQCAAIQTLTRDGVNVCAA